MKRCVLATASRMLGEVMRGSASRCEDDRTGPKGARAYVIGDVHGRLDLLDELLAKIHCELQQRPIDQAWLVFVGDLIDRGPSSAQVIERLRTYRQANVRPIFLLGNHEEVLLRIIEGDSSLVSGWLQFGGIQCLESYGVDAADLRAERTEPIVDLVRQTIPPAHVDFIKSFIDTCRFGDYLFVHAGIRPGIALDEQSQSDLRWIRGPFLHDARDHGFVVVHGHTIFDEVDEQPNRIGIDTGAYRSGVLTALAIEGTRQWVLDTRTTNSF